MSQKKSTSYRGAKPTIKLAYREMTNLGEIANAFAGRGAGAPQSVDFMCAHPAREA